jgi:hypothetical protein
MHPLLTRLFCAAILASLAWPARAGTLYTAYSSTGMNSAVYTNDPVQAQLLLNNINGKGVAPAPGNAYIVLSNGYALPNNGTAPIAYLRALANGNANGALAVFNGDSLTLTTNTTLRLKNNSVSDGGNTTNLFTNSVSPGAPGLILAGGLVENGDNTSNPDTILGVMQAYPGTASYLDTGQNTFQQLNSTRLLRITAIP